MSRRNIHQNKIVVWLDNSSHKNDIAAQHTLRQLQSVIDDVHVFTETDARLSFLFLAKVKEDEVSIVLSGSIDRNFMKQIGEMAQVDAVYIFGENAEQYQSWKKEWSKIRGVHKTIEPICRDLRAAVRQYNEDLMPVSIFNKHVEDGKQPASELDRLEPSFMYVKLLKRIFLKIEHELDEKQALVRRLREENPGKTELLETVKEFDETYRADEAIKWYTRHCFVHQKLNQALGRFEAKSIVDMGFFIRDLHRQLGRERKKQFPNHQGATLTLYRGQTVTEKVLSQLKEKRGGLFAFNTFISTSKSPSIAIDYIKKQPTQKDKVAVLYVITADPKIKSAPFADITKLSDFAQEKEVLFSTNAVFRINDVDKSKDGDFYEVKLTQTADRDYELHKMTKYFRKEIENFSRWERVAFLLIRLKASKRAEEVYLALLERGPSARQRALYYHQLAVIKMNLREYKQAIKYWERAIVIRREILPPTDPQLAASYNIVGEICLLTNNYGIARGFFEKALGILEKSDPPDYSLLLDSYSNIATVYSDLGQPGKALCDYKGKILALAEKVACHNHPNLGLVYNNIGVFHLNTGEDSAALKYHEKALEIQRRSLHCEHAEFVTTYEYIALVHYSMGNCPKALDIYKRALELRKKYLLPDHVDFATCYETMAIYHAANGQHDPAQDYRRQASDTRNKHPPTAHSESDLIDSELDLLRRILQT